LFTPDGQIGHSCSEKGSHDDFDDDDDDEDEDQEHASEEDEFLDEIMHEALKF